MKKFLLFLIALLLLLFCACSPKEPSSEAPGETEKESSPVEKVTVTAYGKDYEVSVPEKTRFEFSDDALGIITPGITEAPAVVDLSGLSGCEEITRLYVTLMSETEKIILPSLPNLTGCEIGGKNPADPAVGNPVIDAAGIEGIESLNMDVVPKELIIGKGPETMTVGYGFDLGLLAGAENIEFLLLHGETDFSKIADIGPIKKIHIYDTVSDFSGLEKLKSLEHLGFRYSDGDISSLRGINAKVLVFGNDVTQKTVDSFPGSESVVELQLDDKYLTNLDIIGKLPNLGTILLTVDPEQPAEIPNYSEITDEAQIDALVTDLPKEELKAFYNRGGIIYIIKDAWRTN